MMRRAVRGLTLIEVLASVALLAALAAAIVPLLRCARAADVPVDDSPAIDVLAIAADTLIASPDRKTLDALAPGAALAFAWPEDADRAPIEVTRHASGRPVPKDAADPGLTGAWFAFRAGETVVLRFAAIDTAMASGIGEAKR